MNAPDYRLDGGVATVTGAGSGIGRAIAVAVAASGASVGCVDLPSADLPGRIEDIIGDGGQAVAVPADVTEPDQMTRAVTRIEQELGPLSAAVNAAGIANAAPAQQMPLEQWQRGARRRPHRGVLVLSGRRQGDAQTAAGRSSTSLPCRRRSPTATYTRPTTTRLRPASFTRSKPRLGMGPQRHQGEQRQPRLHLHTDDQASRAG